MTWTPCPERMPEDGLRVMVFGNLRDFSTDPMVGIGDHDYAWGWNVDGAMVENITHWQPLPEIPK